MDPVTQLAQLLEQCDVERRLMEELESDLRYYAREYLNKIGEGDNYTTEETNLGLTRNTVAQRRDTKSDRAVAVNLLMEMLKTSSAHEVYQYVTTPNFQQMAGANEYQFNLLRFHLSRAIRKFTSRYQSFMQLNNNDTLLDLLLNPAVRENISREQLAMLFWYYNPKLVADVIVNVYEDKAFACNLPYFQASLDYHRLVSLLADQSDALEYVNRVRSSLKAQALLPENCRTPGFNQLTDQGLNRYQLFQYDESTIFAVEQCLFEKFQRLTVNRVLGLPQVTPKPLFAPYYFYLISAARYMLLDPDDNGNANYFRFDDFRNDMRNLLDSHEPAHNRFGRPVIFSGLINSGGTHYIAYFIYKNSQGRIQVITVDPSPRIYPSSVLERNGEPKDSKLKSFNKLRKIFQHIFPDCDVYDPDVSQMLRERDCGPNAATTLQDALSTCESGHPLLSIQDDCLKIDVNQLTVHHQPMGINPYTNSYVYSNKLEEDSLANRAKWQDVLTQIREVRTLTERVTAPGQDFERPMSVHDEYDLTQQIRQEYNYIQLVESQEQQDLREVNISAVHSMLLGAPEGQELINQLISEYRRTRNFPGPEALAAFIKSRAGTPVQLQVLSSAHNNNLDALAQDVTVTLLRDYIPAVLLSVFEADVLARLPGITTLDPDAMVKDFLEGTYGAIYSRLSVFNQRKLKVDLQVMSQRAVEQKFIEVYSGVIRDVFARHCRTYLARISSDLGGLSIEQAMVNQVFTARDWQSDHPQTGAALQFLRVHAEPRLLDIVNRHVSEVITNLSRETARHVIQSLDLSVQNFRAMLAFVNPVTGDFIPWDKNRLLQYLRNSKQLRLEAMQGANILHEEEIDTYVGARALERINQAVYQEIQKKVVESITARIGRFLENPLIQQELSAGRSMAELSSIFDAQGNLLPAVSAQIDYSLLIQRYGSQDTLTQEDFNHVLVKRYAVIHIQDSIAKFLQTSLYQQFQALASVIVNHAASSLLRFGNVLNSGFKIEDAEAAAHALYAEYTRLSPEAYHYFASNFLQPVLANQGVVYQYSNEFNPCGARFHRWFVTTVCQEWQREYKNALRLRENITNSLALLGGVLDYVHAHATAEIYSACQHSVEKLRSMEQALNALVIGVNFTVVLNQACLSEARLAARNLFKACKYGLTDPGSVSAVLRPVLCCLLDIETPCILSSADAAAVDQAIAAKAQDTSCPENYTVRAKSRLITLPEVSQLPATYGKPATRELLLQCIAYWFSQRSIMYGLIHPQLWLASNHMPDFIQSLIDLVNALPDGENGDRAAAVEVRRLKQQIFGNMHISETNIFTSNDIVDQIRAALARTTSITNTASTSVRFSDLTRLLCISGSTKDAGVRQAAAPLSEQEIQSRVMARVRAVRAADPQAEINMGSIHQEVMGAAGMLNAANAEPVLEDMPDLGNQTVSRSLISSLGIFGERMSSIRKDILFIEKKHGNEPGFNLDEADVELLTQRLRWRWRNQVAKLGEEEAVRRYIEAPNHYDMDYLKAAYFLVSRYYRPKGVPLFAFNLLMPGCDRYPAPEQIRQYTLPAPICQVYMLEQDTSSIESIALRNLVITRSGYAYDIDWIINQYQTQHTWINPYTGSDFSKADIDDICRLPRAQELLEAVRRNCCNSMTARGLDVLVEYLNSAIFSSGFSNYYTSEQNSAAFAAYTKMGVRLMQLPRLEQEAFWSETIPCSNPVTTIRQVFEDSRNNCLTQNGIPLARVVLAYRGRSHGLVNADLVRYANDRNIPPRKLESSAKFIHALDQYLFDRMTSRQVTYGGLRP